MRRYGLYDGTRGLTTLLAAGTAGVLLWAASLVGVQTVTHFWEAMGIVAAAGLVLGLSQVVGGWTKGGRVRVSPTTFLLGFLPTLVCVGWILMATQPGDGWNEGTVANWTADLGLTGLVHSLGLWHGVLAFGFGLMLGLTLDTVPAPERAAAVERREAPTMQDDTVRDDETLVADDRGPEWRQRPTVASDADEPTDKEREEAAQAEPTTSTVGPKTTNLQH
jgi:hypothetical protein